MYVACTSFLTGIKIAIIAEIQIAVFLSNEPVAKMLFDFHNLSVTKPQANIAD